MMHVERLNVKCIDRYFADSSFKRAILVSTVMKKKLNRTESYQLPRENLVERRKNSILCSDLGHVSFQSPKGRASLVTRPLAVGYITIHSDNLLINIC